jgi:hypothetical protein
MERRGTGRFARRRLLLTAAAMGAALLPAVPASADTRGQAQVDGTVLWIAVSPAYRQTGLVLASVNAPHCSQECLHLWASHDGGATWERSPASGWGQGRFFIAATSGGGEAIFGEATSGLQRSDDGGATWRTVGPPGSPAVSPGFARDATVVVASAGSSSSDYVLRGGSQSVASGSGGTWTDLGFMLAPSFPVGGRYAPVLLSGADPHSQVPVVEQCDASLVCTTATTITGAGPWALPVMLYPSSTYSDDGAVFAKAGRSIYKSTTGGRAFVPLSVLPDSGGSVTAYPMISVAPEYREAGPVRTVDAAVLQVTVDQADPRRSRSTGGVYRSLDGGATWSRLGSPSPLDSGASAVAVAPDGRLFAGYVGGAQGGAGLLCSTDGSRWAPACPPLHMAGAARVDGVQQAGGGQAPTGCASGCGAAGPRSGIAGGDASAGGGAAATGRPAVAAAGIAGAETRRDDGSSSIPLGLTALLVAVATALLSGTALLPFPGRRARRRRGVAFLRPGRRARRVRPREGRNVNAATQVSNGECRDRG